MNTATIVSSLEVLNGGGKPSRSCARRYHSCVWDDALRSASMPFQCFACRNKR